LSKAAKALLLTWIMIGLLIAGVAGFYLGRRLATKTQAQNPQGTQPQGGMMENQQPPAVIKGQPPATMEQGKQQNLPPKEQLPVPK